MLLDFQNSGLKQASFFVFWFFYAFYCLSLSVCVSTGGHCEMFAVQHWDGMGRWPSAQPSPVLCVRLYVFCKLLG